MAEHTQQVARAGGMQPLSEGRRSALVRRGLRLEYATLGWNVVGCLIVIAAAIAARSVALAGFGLDSVIKIFASVVVVWQLTGASRERERRALRLIGIAFFLLALYVLGQLIVTLLTRTRPDTSLLGIGWLAATLIAMLVLAYGKRVTGRALGNPVLATEAHVTLIDALLAAAVLVGLVLNALLGWWLADPLAGLVIVYYGFKEGRAAWHEGREGLEGHARSHNLPSLRVGTTCGPVPVPPSAPRARLRGRSPSRARAATGLTRSPAARRHVTSDRPDA